MKILLVSYIICTVWYFILLNKITKIDNDQIAKLSIKSGIWTLLFGIIPIVNTLFCLLSLYFFIKSTIRKMCKKYKIDNGNDLLKRMF